MKRKFHYLSKDFSSNFLSPFLHDFAVKVNSESKQTRKENANKKIFKSDSKYFSLNVFLSS